jgi:hypothetical protein
MRDAAQWDIRHADIVSSPLLPGRHSGPLHGRWGRVGRVPARLLENRATAAAGARSGAVASFGCRRIQGFLRGMLHAMEAPAFSYVLPAHAHRRRQERDDGEPHAQAGPRDGQGEEGHLRRPEVHGLHRHLAALLDPARRADRRGLRGGAGIRRLLDPRLAGHQRLRHAGRARRRDRGHRPLHGRETSRGRRRSTSSPPASATPPSSGRRPSSSSSTRSGTTPG